LEKKIRRKKRKDEKKLQKCWNTNGKRQWKMEQGEYDFFCFVAV
jgi:hypothetical protein